MDPGEQTTGTRDEQYNLISVLYHALHGAETIEAYILDAEAAGDERMAAFFQEAQATHRQLAERAKGLLGIGGGGVTPGVGGVPGGVPTGDVPPRTAESGWETPPPPPRRETLPTGTAPPGEDVTPEGAAPPVTPGTEEVPPSEPPPPTDVVPDTPREAPPPGEERPERRGAAPTTPTPREEPPPGEERPERRSP